METTQTAQQNELPAMPAKTKLGQLIEERQVVQDQIDKLTDQKVMIGRQMADIFREQKKKSISTEVNGRKVRVVLKNYDSRIAVIAE